MAIEDNSKVSPPLSELENTSKESTPLPSGDNLKVATTPSKDKDPNEKGFFNRPRRGGKTIWDWLQLLGVPAFLAFATIGFGFVQFQLAGQQHQHDQDL